MPNAGHTELLPLVHDPTLLLPFDILGDTEAVARHDAGGLRLLDEIGLEVLDHHLITLDISIDAQHEVELVPTGILLPDVVERTHLAVLHVILDLDDESRERDALQ